MAYAYLEICPMLCGRGPGIVSPFQDGMNGIRNIYFADFIPSTDDFVRDLLDLKNVWSDCGKQANTMWKGAHGFHFGTAIQTTI